MDSIDAGYSYNRWCEVRCLCVGHNCKCSKNDRANLHLGVQMGISSRNHVQDAGSEPQREGEL